MAAASPARAARAGGTAPPAERASRASTGPPSVHQILEWLAAGQVVTCTLEERPATPLLRRLAAQAPAAPEDKLATVAATVLMVSLSTEQVVLRADAFADPVEPGQLLVADFTHPMGTYSLSGPVAPIHVDGMACLVLSVRHASEVQTRRFGRLPVAILPQRVEVQEVSGQWRTLRAEIVDLALGGLGLRVAEPLPAGAHVHVVFDLPGQFGLLAAHGRIVAAASPAEAHLRAQRCGVTFNRLSADDQRRLRSALEHRHLQLARLSELQLRRAVPTAPPPAVEVPVAAAPSAPNEIQVEATVSAGVPAHGRGIHLDGGGVEQSEVRSPKSEVPRGPEGDAGGKHDRGRAPRAAPQEPADRPESDRFLASPPAGAAAAPQAGAPAPAGHVGQPVAGGGTGVRQGPGGQPRGAGEPEAGARPADAGGRVSPAAAVPLDEGAVPPGPRRSPVEAAPQPPPAPTAAAHPERLAQPPVGRAGFPLGSPLKVAQQVARHAGALRPAAPGARTGVSSATESVTTPRPPRAAAPPAARGGHLAALQKTWPSDPQSTAWFADGVYRLFARHLGQFVAVSGLIANPFLDVVVSAAFRKVGGPPGGEYGVIVRDEGPGPRDGVNQHGWFYVLAVSDRGEVAIRRRQDDRWLQVVPWTPTEAIRPGGETNVLTARAIGQHLTFLVNGVEVASHADTVRRHGAVGVFVGGDLTEVALERFATHVPAAVPSPRSEVRRPKSEARRF